MKKVTFEIPLNITDTNGDILKPGAIKEGKHKDAKGNSVEISHEPCCGGVGKIVGVILVPVNDRREPVTEDAEFEIIQPKQISNG